MFGTHKINPDSKNLYHRLGLSSQVSMKEIKNRYKELANNDSFSQNDFFHIREAYEILHDYHQRRRYDDDRSMHKMEKNEEDNSYVTNNMGFNSLINNFMDFNFGSNKNPSLSYGYSYSGSSSLNTNDDRIKRTQKLMTFKDGEKKEYTKHAVYDRRGNLIESSGFMPSLNQDEFSQSENQESENQEEPLMIIEVPSVSSETLENDDSLNLSDSLPDLGEFTEDEPYYKPMF